MENKLIVFKWLERNIKNIINNKKGKNCFYTKLKIEINEVIF